jgi:hypothetical protein
VKNTTKTQTQNAKRKTQLLKTQQRNNATTQQRNNATTQQRNNATTQQRNNAKRNNPNIPESYRVGVSHNLLAT